MHERLQKILASHGFGSRRKAEELIREGRVRVNGAAAILGQKADPRVDQIEIDGKPLAEGGTFLYYVMNKPVGVVTTNIGRDTLPRHPHPQRINTMVQERGQKKHPTVNRTVRDLLPPELRGVVVPVGRLDKDSEGLLLFTNDGALAQHLMHPRFEHEKEYEVRVDKAISNGALQQLKKGLFLHGEPTQQTRIKRLEEGLFRIILTEGRNRQIRRMCEKLGYRVTGLRRIRIVTLTDSRLKSGQLRQLTSKEIIDLRSALGLPSLPHGSPAA